MRTEQLGDGTPEVAVVAAIHGDEPCGVRAVERLLDDPPAVERPVKFVVANEAALARDVRYVDEDLNRAFPGDPDADTHEGRLAAALARELRGCTVLSLHSTQSYAEPFALVDGVDEVARSVCPHLPVSVVVETGRQSEGRLIEYPDVIEVECGRQGSDRAADNAVELIYGFLRATGVLPDDSDAGERLPADSDAGEQLPDEQLSGGQLPDEQLPDEQLPDASTDRDEVVVYRLGRPIPKSMADEYEVFAENFEEVPAGEAFAAADDRELIAEESFYPVLLSPYGYEDVFGYRGEHVGLLDGSSARDRPGREDAR